MADDPLMDELWVLGAKRRRAVYDDTRKQKKIKTKRKIKNRSRRKAK